MKPISRLLIRESGNFWYNSAVVFDNTDYYSYYSKQWCLQGLKKRSRDVGVWSCWQWDWCLYSNKSSISIPNNMDINKVKLSSIVKCHYIISKINDSVTLFLWKRGSFCFRCLDTHKAHLTSVHCPVNPQRNNESCCSFVCLFCFYVVA